MAVAALGAMALALIVMTVMQVYAVVHLVRLGGQIRRLVQRVDQEVAPLVANLVAASEHASRVAALIEDQVVRFDRLTADVAARYQEALGVLHAAAAAPAREGAAILIGIKAALNALRGVRTGRRREASVEEEEALFIG